MNWKLVGLLSVLGVAMGVKAVLGLVQENERLFWITLAVLMGLILAQNRVPKPFLHGLLTGFLAGLVAMIIEAAFLPTYLANNPVIAGEFTESASKSRLFLLLSSPAIGALYGLFVGSMTWLASSLLFRTRA